MVKQRNGVYSRGLAFNRRLWLLGWDGTSANNDANLPYRQVAPPTALQVVRCPALTGRNKALKLWNGAQRIQEGVRTRIKEQVPGVRIGL